MAILIIPLIAFALILTFGYTALHLFHSLLVWSQIGRPPPSKTKHHPYYERLIEESLDKEEEVDHIPDVTNEVKEIRKKVRSRVTFPRKAD